MPDCRLRCSNAFTGRVPWRSFQWPHLQTLALAGNQLSGPIATRDLPTAVRDLLLVSHSIAPQHLPHSKCPFLQDNNRFSGAMPSFTGLSKLYTLTLHENKVNAPHWQQILDPELLASRS